MQRVLNFLVRLLFLAAGLVFAASLLVALLCFAAFWALRYGWARLTGKPVTPFVMRIDPRAGFNRFYASEMHASDMPQPEEEPVRRPIADITDVEIKQPKN
mgnify:CR=1 FL=1